MHSPSSEPHAELRLLRAQLQTIYSSLPNFNVSLTKPPVLYSSHNGETGEDKARGQDFVTGLRGFIDAVKRDLDVVDKFLARPDLASLPPLSTNAPYLIAVYNELITAPPPVLAVWKAFPLLLESASSSGSTDGKKGKGKVTNVKIDVVAAGGKQWIRVNTLKNSRLLAELREIDSYDTDSSQEDSGDEGAEKVNYLPSLAQTEFDNSLLQAGRELIAAARANPYLTSSGLPLLNGSGGTPVEARSSPSLAPTPTIVLRLPRLDPTASASSGEGDPRIGQTISKLTELGLDVRIGGTEVPESLSSLRDASLVAPPSPKSQAEVYTLSSNVNLDLSILIALVSDLTHTSFPATTDDVDSWFIPPPRERPWRATVRSKNLDADTGASPYSDDEEEDVESDGEPGHDRVEPDPNAISVQHSRALSFQALQEIKRGMIDEMAERIRPLCISGEQVVFWTTTEARLRCLRIVEKIGGPGEKRRARALLWVPSDEEATGTSKEDAMDAFWRGSRYSRGFLPFIPLAFHPDSVADLSHLRSASTPTSAHGGVTNDVQAQSAASHPFYRQLADACRSMLLSQEEPHRNAPVQVSSTPGSTSIPLSSQPDPSLQDNGNLNLRLAGLSISTTSSATALRLHPRLTVHTVESLLWGARLGWTTITANKSSVRAVLRGMRAVHGAAFGLDDGLARTQSSAVGGATGPGEGDGPAVEAVPISLWVFAPRSLAEEMRRDFDPETAD